MKTNQILLCFVLWSLIVNLAIGKEVYIYAENVHIRDADGPCFSSPSTECPVIGSVTRAYCDASCQLQGELIEVKPYPPNDWWSLVQCPGVPKRGWVTNLYIRGPAKLEGVPKCRRRTV